MTLVEHNAHTIVGKRVEIYGLTGPKELLNALQGKVVGAKAEFVNIQLDSGRKMAVRNVNVKEAPPKIPRRRFERFRNKSKLPPGTRLKPRESVRQRFLQRSSEAGSSASSTAPQLDADRPLGSSLDGPALNHVHRCD